MKTIIFSAAILALFRPSHITAQDEPPATSEAVHPAVGVEEKASPAKAIPAANEAMDKAKDRWQKLPPSSRAAVKKTKAPVQAPMDIPSQ